MAKPESASGASRELVRAHRVWIIEIGHQLGLTTTQIAKQAGLVATTLARLANDPDHKHALSSTTIDKIVRKFGVSPPITPDLAIFRGAVAHAIAALHRQRALQLGTPELVASMVIELADWLTKAASSFAVLPSSWNTCVVPLVPTMLTRKKSAVDELVPWAK